MDTKDKPIRVALPPDQHAQLRVLAAKAGIPMSQFVRGLIERELSKNKNS